MRRESEPRAAGLGGAQRPGRPRRREESFVPGVAALTAKRPGALRWVVYAVLVFGIASAVLGLFAARQWALAAGGTIVLVAAALFALASIVAGARRAGAQADSILSGPH